MNITKFTPIELLLFLAMNMLGLVSGLLELIGPTSLLLGGNVVSFQILSMLSIYVPSITVTPFNHVMLICSFFLSLLGSTYFFTGKPKVRKLWIYLQLPYWAAQFLAFVLIGVYPIAGVCIGLYFGTSIYLALNQNLVGG